jgi:hypothetical protein
VTPTRADRKIEFTINVVITDCPHPTAKINYLLVNKGRRRRNILSNVQGAS